MTKEIKEVEVIEEELEEVVELVEEAPPADGEGDDFIEEEEESLPETVTVGDKEFTLVKTGADQAKQVSDLLNWLGNYGEKLASSFIVDDKEEVSVASLGGVWGLVASIGKVSTQQALMDLFVVVIGCSKKEADEYFSIGILVDGVQVLLAQEEYAKVLDRFF